MSIKFFKQLLACSTLFVLFSCSKNSSVSRAQLLTQSSWKYDVEGADDNGNGVVDALENDFVSCDMDDVLTFQPNGKLIISFGSNMCDPSETVPDTLSWSLTNNDNTLLIDGFPVTITVLNDHLLETTFPDPPTVYIQRLKR